MRLWTLFWLMLLWAPAGLAVIPEPALPKAPGRTVASTDIAAWGFALVIVLAVFFLCVWGLRKLGGFSAGGTAKMRLLGGLSLGLRERVVLLQVGEKQLLLGVTPGRIQTLLVLEGEDCLLKETAAQAAYAPDSGFAQKLAQILKTRPEQQRHD
jgi:flagellar protein FliO/FliZ